MSLIDAAARGAYGVELVVAPAPKATQGYDDLRRDATPMRIAEDLIVDVASLVDLVRIAHRQSLTDGLHIAVA